MALAVPEPQIIVIFGASGDLTHRKIIPALYNLLREKMLPERFAIVGYARTQWTDEQFKEEARKSLEEFSRTSVDDEYWEPFSEALSYRYGAFDDEKAFHPLHDHLAELDKKLGTDGRRLYYAATPPSAFPVIIDRIGECPPQPEQKIVIEKPFGRDLKSARELNDILHKEFDESQIFRIDHYLGKETVQNITALRFSNGMFEPIWNRRYIDNVQITAAEEIGIEGRASFYEETGTLRDMVQTHLFQVLTFVAMEPPVTFDPDRLRDEKVRVLRSMQPIDPKGVVRGQYVGYRDEPDVPDDSQADTFAALQLEVDNWRWAGVKFNLRTGKKLRRKQTEISLSFKEVPYNVFRGTDATPLGRDALIMRVQPNEGITLALNIKKPGVGLELDRAELHFNYGESYSGPLIEAYETLLLEAMEGDHTLFTREDEVERAWEILDPVLKDPPPVEFYEPGTWGPEEADALVLPRHWHLTPEDEERKERGL
jgi:glucose-6-phosphate 1-dehydrogenase